MLHQLCDRWKGTSVSGRLSASRCPGAHEAAFLLSAVLPVHPDHLLSGAVGGHPGLHLQGKCTYRAPGPPTRTTSEGSVAIQGQRLPPQSQQPLIQQFQPTS